MVHWHMEMGAGLPRAVGHAATPRLSPLASNRARSGLLRRTTITALELSILKIDGVELGWIPCRFVPNEVTSSVRLEQRFDGNQH